MKLIEDWKTLWHRLWSVKLALLSALVSAGDVLVTYLMTGQPALLSIGAALFSLLAALMRLVAQPELHND